LLLQVKVPEFVNEPDTLIVEVPPASVPADIFKLLIDIGGL